MHSHDHDLIAAVAEGILAGELASSAEAEITACPECASELSAQRNALRALAEFPPAGLTFVEASRLRDAVAGALGVAATPASRPARQSRRSPWTAIAIAAGLAGVITLIPVIGLINTGSDDGATDTVAAALEADDTTNSSPREGTAEAAYEDSEMSTTLEDAEALVAGAEAPSPTGEAAATTTMASLGTDPAGLRLAADGQEAIGSLFEAGPIEKYLESTEQADLTGAACNAEAEQTFGNAYVYVTTPASLDDGRPVVLYAAADWSVLVAFDLADCSAALTLP